MGEGRGYNFKESGQRRPPRNLTLECKDLEEVRKRAILSQQVAETPDPETVTYLQCSRNHRDTVRVRRE